MSLRGVMAGSLRAAQFQEAMQKIAKLTAENARLRDELAHAREAERERCANTVNALQRWWAKNYSTESESVATVLDGVAERLRALKDEP